MSYLNWRMFGVFMPNAGYYLIRGQQDVLVFTPQIGVLGLLFDRVFGLVPRAPIYLLAAAGLVPLLRRAWGTELAALFLGWLAYFLYVANIAYWVADGSPPSRYLVAGLPFLVVLLAAGVERVGELRRARELRPATLRPGAGAPRQHDRARDDEDEHHERNGVSRPPDEARDRAEIVRPAQELLQIGAHLGRARVAILPAALQRLHHDAIQGGRKLGPVGARRGDGLIHQRQQYAELRVPLEDAAGGEQLVEGDTQ